MGIFDRSMFADPDDDAGVFIDHLGRALVTWTAMQDHTTTVPEAAQAFNTTPEIILEAIASAMWITSTDDGIIELDGE